MIQIKNVNKIIDENHILKDVNINVDKGNIFGLIGPNGAGKTTLIKCMTGIWRIDSGIIKILDENVFENKKLKEKIGYVADQNTFYRNFKIEDIVNFYKLSYKTFNINKFNELNLIFKLRKKQRISSLSKGMKMKLSIMLALSIMPELLIMDEPTSGLDPLVKREVLNMIVNDVSERGTTVFVSSHNLSELERICDCIGMMNNGSVDYIDSLENMKKNIRKIQVVFKGKAPVDIENWSEILNVSNIGRVYYIITKKYTKEFETKLKNFGVDFIEEIDLSLEDMFIYSAGGVSYDK